MGEGKMGLPDDLRQQGKETSELNMLPRFLELVGQGYEEVTDAEIVEKVRVIPPDGVVEEHTPDLGSLSGDPDYDYEVVLDESGTSEIMHGKPKFALLRKLKEQVE
ncbi:hypothetical protein KKB10_01550 [Patescibacteria group bacterium]|nr:hypothetical protein [Patescibacteria group bacterium]MBU1951300.1 hypothetical protein [Patescibacteria group bacterium]